MPTMENPITQPQISLDMFSRLLQKLSATDLASLPTSKLPRHIPEEVIQSAPVELQLSLRELAMQLDMDRLGGHVEDLDRYGQTLANALQKAETHASPQASTALAHSITELANMLHAWQQSTELTGNTQLTINFENLLERFTSAAELAEDLRGQLASFNRAEYLIATEGRKAGIHRTRLTDAVAQLRAKTEHANKQMAQFNTLRLSLCQQEMQRLKNKITIEANNQQTLQADIDSLRKELDSHQSLWRKALAKYRNSDDYTEMQNQISALIVKKNSAEVIVSENNLQRWLDAVIDTSLDSISLRLCSNLLPEARGNLYWLLKQYSKQQESGARQIARNPFSQVNPESAIEYMLLSERFILEYFAHRQQDDPFWFGSSIHERREQLAILRNEILRELKINMS